MGLALQIYRLLLRSGWDCSQSTRLLAKLALGFSLKLMVLTLHKRISNCRFSAPSPIFQTFEASVIYASKFSRNYPIKENNTDQNNVFIKAPYVAYMSEIVVKRRGSDIVMFSTDMQLWRQFVVL